jgi:hypothetical protein
MTDKPTLQEMVEYLYAREKARELEDRRKTHFQNDMLNPFPSYPPSQETNLPASNLFVYR